MTIAEEAGTPTYLCKLVIIGSVEGFTGVQTWGESSMTHKE